MNPWLAYMQLWQATWAALQDMSAPEDDVPFRLVDAPGADWNWEQDEELRLTSMSSRLGDRAPLDPSPYFGQRRLEQPAPNLTPEDRQRHRVQLERREPFRDLEIQHIGEDGRVVWLSLSADPVFQNDGTFKGYRGAARDVTGRKRREELARLEHAVTRCLVDTASTAEALQCALGSICEAEGWDCGELLAFDEATQSLRRRERWCVPGVAGEFSLLNAGGEPVGSAGLLSTALRTGEPAWVSDFTNDPRAVPAGVFEAAGMRSAVLHPVRFGDRVTAVLCFAGRRTRARDEGLLAALANISGQLGRCLQRALVEQGLREAEARARRLANLSSDWYWEQDASYCFTRVEGRNPLGEDPDFKRRLIGIRRWESGLEVEGGWDAHRTLLDERRPFYDVLMWRTMPDGSVRYFAVSGEPVIEGDGRFVGYHGVGREITAQKRAEQTLRLEHEVAQALAKTDDTAAGLKAVIRTLCESEGWDSGRYYRMEEASGGLHFEDGWCVTEPGVEHFLERSGPVWKFGQAVWSGEVAAEGRLAAGPDAAGRGAFAFPVISEGKTLGVLAFSGSLARDPDRRLLEAARVIGSQVGQFLRRKQAEAALKESEARFRSLTQMSSDFFWETDERHRIVGFVHGPSYAASQVGVAVMGKSFWDIASAGPDAAAWAAHRATLDSRIPFRDFEFAAATPDGVTRHFSVSGEPRFAADGSFCGYRGVGRDITEIALTRERIATLAFSDPLTGLANRSSLGPSLEQAIERARRHEAKLAGAFIDLDGFKQINDLHGHDAGDQFLVALAQRLRLKVRASDLLARLGGDEFFLVLEEVHDAAAVESVVRKLLAEALRPFELPGGAQVSVSASIGVSLFPDDAADAADLIKHGDMAMYAAKQAGKNGYRFFSSLGTGKDAENDGSDHMAA